MTEDPAQKEPRPAWRGDPATRYLSRSEALESIRRGHGIAQLLRYTPARLDTATFEVLWVGGVAPRGAVTAGLDVVEDTGDGVAGDIGWFPRLNEWDLDLEGTDDPVFGAGPPYLEFENAERALEWCEMTLDAAPDLWRSESMIGDEYLAARRSAT